MFRMILVSSVLIFAAGSAQAETISNCRTSYYTGTTCSARTIEAAPAVGNQARRISQEEVREENERIAKWQAFCRPTPITNNEGITRLIYAQPGCDLGRSE